MGFRDIANKSGEPESTVSGNTSFLTAIGVLQKEGTLYSLTPLGIELGAALAENSPRKAEAWSLIIQQNVFFQDVIQFIRQNKEHIEEKRLREQIISRSNIKPTKEAQNVASKVIVDILEDANLVERTGKRTKIVTLKQQNEIKFIDIKLIDELRRLKSNEFDLSRLIKYCQEMNDNYRMENFSSVLFLTRAILDHIPPIFGEKNFASIAEHLPTRNSLKGICQRLDDSSKRIADHHIHRQITSKELLPSQKEIDFRQDLHFLLSRIVEILHTTDEIQS